MLLPIHLTSANIEEGNKTHADDYQSEDSQNAQKITRTDDAQTKCAPKFAVGLEKASIPHAAKTRQLHPAIYSSSGKG